MTVNFYKTVLTSRVIALISTLPCFFSIQQAAAQNNQLEFYSGSAPAANTGATLGPVVATFFKNTNNASNTFAAYTPTLTATYTISNNQYAYSGVAATNASVNIGNTGTRVDNMNFIDNPLNASFSTDQFNIGTGIKVPNNFGVHFDIYTGTLTANSIPLTARPYMADLTITFNRPVNNPILHISGLGGFSNATGFCTELELQTANISLSLLSGNGNMTVTSNKILNNRPVPGSDASSAGGSILAAGTGITSLTFKLYMRADASSTTDWGTGNFTAVDKWVFGISFAPTQVVSGNLFNDANGLVNSTVDGTGTNISGGTYANLVDGQGNIITSTAIASNGSYSLPEVFTGTQTMQVSTSAGTISSAAPAPALPAGWVNTGENTGVAAGNDGTVDGKQSITVAQAAITDVNFGAERLPVGAAYTATSQLNPGGTTTVSVPNAAFTGTDGEDGTYTTGLTGKKVTLNPATNGTLYYNGSPVSAATTITSFNPTLVTIDPAGTTQVAITPTFTYSVFDAADKASLPATVSVPFTAAATITLNGTVVNDVNGLTNSNVDGTGIGSPSGTQLYANLISGGLVTATVPVNADGTYSFTSVVPNTTYTVQVSTNQGTVGVAAPAIALPTNWVSAGEDCCDNVGSDGTVDGTVTVVAGASNVTNINFGIEQRPNAGTATAPLQANPGGTNSVTVPPGTFSGTDPDGGTATAIKITSFPTNTTTVTINGTPYTTATFPGGGVTVPADATGAPTQSITIDPIDGIVDVIIPYTVIDNAGIEDLTPGSATMSFSALLPLSDITLNGVYSRNQIDLLWSSTDNSDVKEYAIERSNNGADFVEIGTVKNTGDASIRYSYVDPLNDFTGNAVYYRIKAIDVNGNFKYSGLFRLTLSGISALTVLPNPFVDLLNVQVMSANRSNAIIRILSNTGQEVNRVQKQLEKGVNSLQVTGLGGLSKGIFVIEIYFNGEYIRKKLIKQ
jgi:hypothetical protein